MRLYNRLLSKLRTWFVRQEEIFKQLEFTEGNEHFEQIFYEASGAQMKGLTEV